jgi:sucrose phosphorylase
MLATGYSTMKEPMASYTSFLYHIYPLDIAQHVEPRLIQLVEKYRSKIPKTVHGDLSQKDVILIAYGDQLKEPFHFPLRTLHGFCKKYLIDIISGLHILSLFPYSSDDGFSILDYRSIDPKLGDWGDIRVLRNSFSIMVDAVINHASVKGNWFKGFLVDEPPYRDYFVTIEGEPDLSSVFRPRAHPLLTSFLSSTGERKVWTTFSSDQADLDFHNPDVLLEIVDILLFYISQGVRFIRLDAIAYLWKEIGTKCLHLPQTHSIVKLIRAIINDIASQVIIVTETNVPHQDNLSYFGNGIDEAQIIYNFALPPLVLHTFQSANSNVLTKWAKGLFLPSKSTTFLNFLASHDGIGLSPAIGLLTEDEIQKIVQQSLKHGGLISNKSKPDGGKTPYELNINYFDALSDPNSSEDLELQISRFMAAQAIMLSMQGIPGIYFHSMFGSRGWMSGVQQTGMNRTINRQKLTLLDVENELNDPVSLRAKVYKRFRYLLLLRRNHPAFHPQAEQKILEMGSSVFALERISPDGRDSMLCIQNVTSRTVSTHGFSLDPYETLWVNNLK